MALFLDTEDFKRHAPEIHRNYHWDTLKVSVDQITRLRVIDYISQAEYDNLESAYLGSSLSAKQTILLTYLQPAIAYFTYLHLLSTNRVQLSTMGVQESRSDDGTSSPASYHAIADVKEEVAEIAYSFMEQALAYLESEKATFTDWASSESYTLIKSIFVWNTSLFNKYVKSGMSRYTFLSVRAQLLSIQEDEILPELGQTFYDSLLTKLAANSLTADEQKVVDRIQAWQAPAAMLRAIPIHRVKLLDGGLQMRSHLDGPERNQTATLDAIQELKDQLARQTAAAKTRLLNFLTTNSDTYTDFTPSEHLLDDGAVSHKLPNNSFKKSFRV